MYRLIPNLPEDEHGRKPDKETLDGWRTQYMWDARADDLDTKAIELADNSLILQKAEMLKRHAENAKKIADQALEFLVGSEGGFDSSASAVNAYFRGTEEERTARGISDLIIKMSKMSDDDLQKEILERLRRGSENEQIIDSEAVDTESKENSAKDSN